MFALFIYVVEYVGDGGIVARASRGIRSKNHFPQLDVEEKGGFPMPEPDLLVTKITVPPVRSALLQRSHLLTVLDQSRSLMFLFSPQQQEERAYLYQLQEGVELLLQSEDQTSLPEAERNRLRHRLIILDGWRLATQALSDGDVEQMSRLAEQMQHIPPDDDTMWQQHQLAPFGMAWRMAGNFPPMVAALQESRKSTQMTQNRYLEAQILWGLIVALIALGQLWQAHDRCQELQQLVDRLGGPLPVAEFLNQVMGLTLSAEDIVALERRTEGWIAGLQLAALSLHGHEDVTSFIQSFTGSHHFVLDYLLEEVLGPPGLSRSHLSQPGIRGELHHHPGDHRPGQRTGSRQSALSGSRDLPARPATAR